MGELDTCRAILRMVVILLLCVAFDVGLEAYSPKFRSIDGFTKGCLVSLCSLASMSIIEIVAPGFKA